MNELRLLRVVIRNFQSYGNNETVVNLDFTDSILIVGRNHDQTVDGNLDSNGAGKTTILNAVSFCLYDKPISKISKDGLVNRYNGKDLYVAVDFTKNGKYYRVERYRKNKSMGGDGVRFLEREGDDQFDPATDDHTRDSIGGATEQIREVIGIPFDVFSRIAIFSAVHKPFLELPASSTSASVANQKDIIEELFGITELSVKAKKLNEDIKENKKLFERIEEINNTLKRERQNHENLVAGVNEQIAEWEEGKTKELARIDARIADLSGINFEDQLQLAQTKAKCVQRQQTYNNAILTAQKNAVRANNALVTAKNWDKTHAESVATNKAKLATYTPVDQTAEEAKFTEIGELNMQATDLSGTITSLSRSIKEDDKTLTKLKGEAEHLSDSKCPYCSQNYAEAMVKLDTIELEIGVLTNSIASNKRKLTDAETDLEAIETKMGKLKASLRFKTSRELSDYVNQFKRLEAEAEMLADAMNPFNIEALQAEVDAAADDEVANTNKLRGLDDVMAQVTEDLQFDSEAAVVRAETELSNLQEKRRTLEESVNPHAATLAKIAVMTFEDLKDDELNTLKDTMDHQEFLYKLLSKKDSFIRKFLLQKNLPFLNTRLKSYMTKMGLPHRVSFKEDLSVKISQLGVPFDYEELSSGQRARVNIALSFAFRDVLQARHGKMNLCILDEILDTGLSDVGVQMAAKTIREIAKEEKLSMFIISHRNEIGSMYENQLVVELRNGYSTILPPE